MVVGSVDRVVGAEHPEYPKVSAARTKRVKVDVLTSSSHRPLSVGPSRNFAAVYQRMSPPGLVHTDASSRELDSIPSLPSVVRRSSGNEAARVLQRERALEV